MDAKSDENVERSSLFRLITFTHFLSFIFTHVLGSSHHFSFHSISLLHSISPIRVSTWHHFISSLHFSVDYTTFSAIFSHPSRSPFSLPSTHPIVHPFASSPHYVLFLSDGDSHHFLSNHIHFFHITVIHFLCVSSVPFFSHSPLPLSSNRRAAPRGLSPRSPRV